ncbi:MAG TPA: hypothetical protein VGV89_10585 [Thermoplasmata archaeon]|nr:hypothetical protein [Thermoplasmata archaeon]
MMRKSRDRTPPPRSLPPVVIAPLALGIVLLLAVPVGASPSPSATKILTAPYTGTLGFASTQTTYTSCSTAVGGTSRWVPSAGVVVAHPNATARACPYYAGFGGGGQATVSTTVEVIVPFRVTYNGTHLIRSNWTIDLASTRLFTSGGCPAKLINYHPPSSQSSYAGCSDGVSLALYIDARVVDISGGSFLSANYSYGNAYNDGGYSNYTTCYTYYTSSYCYNSSSAYNSSNSYGNSAPGFGAFVWNGATNFLMWSNASYMTKTDRFALEFTLTFQTEANAQVANTVSPWHGAAFASINLFGHGRGVRLNQLLIT